MKCVDGSSPYFRRHDVHPRATLDPVGALVEYMPNQDDPRSAFEPKLVFGLFIGYDFKPGCVWSGDYLVAPFAKFQDGPEVRPGHLHVCRTSRIHLNPAAMRFPIAEYREQVQTTVAPSRDERVAQLPSVPAEISTSFSSPRSSSSIEPIPIPDEPPVFSHGPTFLPRGVRGEAQYWREDPYDNESAVKRFRGVRGTRRPPNIHLLLLEGSVWRLRTPRNGRRIRTSSVEKHVREAEKRLYEPCRLNAFHRVQGQFRR